MPEESLLNAIIRQAPVVAVLLYIVYKQEQRLDLLLRQLSRCLEKFEQLNRITSQEEATTKK